MIRTKTASILIALFTGSVIGLLILGCPIDFAPPGECNGRINGDLQTIPNNFELSQNFPNPFNPATTIRFGLPTGERVTLKIYNVLGKEVATLINDEPKKAGYHTSIWDGRNRAGGSASGIYFVRIHAGNFVQTRKMLLVQ